MLNKYIIAFFLVLLLSLILNFKKIRLISSLFIKSKADVLLENSEVRVTHVCTFPEMYPTEVSHDENEMESFIMDSYLLITEKKGSLSLEKHQAYINSFKIYLKASRQLQEFKNERMDEVDSEMMSEIIGNANVKVKSKDGEMHYGYQVSNRITNFSITEQSKVAFVIKYFNTDGTKPLFEKTLKDGAYL